MRVRDLAIKRSEARATPGFNEVALAAVKVCAERYETFTTDEVLEQISNLASTHDYRALGATMLKAARIGFIRSTDRFIPSKRESRHFTKIQVWASLVWHGTPKGAAL
jgi:hypothetical protein